MQLDAFWQHWQVGEEPFRGEEARNDPVFHRLMDGQTGHPDLEKIFGQPDQPSTAVVFGEKGSGKTALRLTLERRLHAHNQTHPGQRIWVVRYDDLNPVIDRIVRAMGRRGRDEAAALEAFRLSDHQDAILSLTVTRLVDAMLTADQSVLGAGPQRAVRQLPRGQRIDLAVLAALYDQPHTGNFMERWRTVAGVLKPTLLPSRALSKWAGLAAAAVAMVAVSIQWLTEGDSRRLTLISTAAAIVAAGLLGYWLWRTARLYLMARRIRKEVHAVDRAAGQLVAALGRIAPRDLQSQPIPVPGDHDARYQLTARLLDVLKGLGYRGMLVLMDRVDEPALVNGDAQRMKSLVWPMLNNKFLQQDRFGIKMLLPIELRHLLRREGADFFQRARLDKQHLIERLSWSGATLYDLCSQRLTACRASEAAPLALTDTFDEDVTRQDLIDALDQMQQPRDAFKFLYQVIHEHCANVPQDQPQFRIPRLTMLQVRKQQSQRLSDLQRGLGPA